MAKKNHYTYHVNTDYQGTIMAITNQSCSMVAELSYDAWGRRRNTADWTYNKVAQPLLFYRGYTGQEHLDQFKLINLNGRMYDPVLGRFLSADNYVPTPGFSQGYNRYAYVLNNPLRFTDPDGQFPVVAVAAGVVIGAYLGGTIANNFQFNPFKWSWDSKTFIGMGIGAIAGGTMGYCLAEGLVSIQCLGSFGLSYDYRGQGIEAFTMQASLDVKIEEAKRTNTMLLYLPFLNLMNNRQSNNSGLIASNDPKFVSSGSSSENKYDIRNLFPVAKSYAIDGHAFFVGGGDVKPIGAIVMFQGKNAGEVFPFSDAGFGNGIDLSIGIIETNYFYIGNIDNLSIESFNGWRAELNISATEL